MKLLFDTFPVILFFIAYQLYGFFIATAVAMFASVAQLVAHWLKHHKFETMHIVTVVLILLLGGITLFSHDELFFKWKVSVVNWVLALALIVSRYIGKKNLLERMLEKNLTMPSLIWDRLNTSWAVFFTCMGFINLYVMYNFTTDVWVNFKLFGVLGLTLVFGIAQSLYMAKHIDMSEDETE